MNTPTTTPRRRRFLRVSLRTLLVLLTIGCVWLGWKVNKAQKQRAAVAWVEEMGGEVGYEYIGDSYDPPARAWLEDFIGVDFFLSVDTVFLYNSSVSDLTPLARFPNLTYLAIIDTNVTDAKPLLTLKRLKHLYLDGSSISKKDLSMLKDALPYCRIESNVGSNSD